MSDELNQIRLALEQLKTIIAERCAERRADINKNTDNINKAFDKIRAVDKTLNDKLQEMETRLNDKITHLKVEMTKIQVVVVIVQAALTAAIIKFIVG